MTPLHSLPSDQADPRADAPARAAPAEIAEPTSTRSWAGPIPG